MFDCDKIQNRKESRRYIYDVYLLAAIVLSSLIWILINNLCIDNGDYIEVSYTNDNETTTKTYPLNKDEVRNLVFYYDETASTYLICEITDLTELSKFKNTEYNIIQIADGAVDITEANCKDLTCVHTRKATRNGETIICLPHKLIIEVRSTVKTNTNVDKNNPDENNSDTIDTEGELDAVTW